VGNRAASGEVAAGVAGFKDQVAAAWKTCRDPGADAVSVVAAWGAAEFDAEEVFVGPAGAQEEGFGGLDGADVEVEGAVVVGVEGDYGAAVGFEVETVQEGTLFEEVVGGGAGGVAGAVSEIAVAFDAGDAGAFAVEGLCAGDSRPSRRGTATRTRVRGRGRGRRPTCRWWRRCRPGVASRSAATAPSSCRRRGTRSGRRVREGAVRFRRRSELPVDITSIQRIAIGRNTRPGS
jgi:hypothetical protein